MMNSTLEETRGASVGSLSDRYLFKGVVDAVLYLLVYFVLPLYSVVQGLYHMDGAIYFTALSCCFCVIYDCYSRYDKHGRRSKIIKIYCIAIIHGLLAVYTFFAIQYYLSEGILIFPWVYILLAVAPVIGGVDLIHIIRDDYRSRSE